MNDAPRLSGAAINRSPKSYGENPREERDSYGTSTDETVHQLHVVSHPDNEIMGLGGDSIETILA